LSYYLDILKFNLKLISLAGDVPRVDGQLAVARAFGDRSLKKHLSSDPYVIEETIDEYTDFLILASDGLWKVMHMKLLQTIPEGFMVLPNSQHGLVYI
jgi:protein phosphatase 1L